LLKEYPQTLRQLARLVSSSPWAAQYLTRQPHLLDELLDPRQLMAPPDWSRVRQELRMRLAAFHDDVERQMDLLRHFKQSETFRLLAQDLSGLWTLEKLSDHLSDLADLLVGATLDLVWQSLAGKHRPASACAFAVIAYGKLGGKELGYASDLDIVFLYDDDASRRAGHLRAAGQTPEHLDGYADLRRHPVRNRSAPATGRRCRTCWSAVSKRSRTISCTTPGPGNIRR
jgi:glutamate-ammonia-ligase adenylyltransferase